MAALTGRAVDAPEQADFIVDDIVDSGRTRAQYRKLYPKKPFRALVTKRDGMGWVQFPWEKSPDQDAEDSVVRLLEFLGENPKREGLVETPRRVVKALKEMTAGYAQEPGKILSTIFAKDGYDQMVICRSIEFTSLCEHHLLPFTGVAHVGYIPRHHVVGLSKMARLVDAFARRLQIQERLTQQIAQTMMTVLRPKGVGVMVQAKHGCMSCRGVLKHQSEMVTTCLLGSFRRHEVREEFFFQVRR